MRKTRYVVAALAAGVIAAVAFAAVAGAQPASKQDDSLSGAGSTFVAPLIAQWQQAYKNASIIYNPVGSGAGITAIQNRTVDFGASDAPLTVDQFISCHGCVMLPWALGATAVLYNLPGVKNNLHLTGKVIAGIYLGKITKWNDPAITKLNKGVNLPSTDITPVNRSDGSGTTYNFTDYLSSVSPEWANKVGHNTAVDWPSPKAVGARGARACPGWLPGRQERSATPTSPTRWRTSSSSRPSKPGPASSRCPASAGSRPRRRTCGRSTRATSSRS